MIQSTYNCGCPPPVDLSSGSKPSCSPCCPPSGRSERKPSFPPGCPQSPCCGSQPPEPTGRTATDNVYYSQHETDEDSTRREVSEIARKGLPYKELEIVINDNRMVLRTQKGPIPQVYDPPCDCLADESGGDLGIKPSNSSQDEIAGNSRTVTLYPKPGSPSGVGSSSALTKETDHAAKEKAEKSSVKAPIDPDENPNKFLLRIRKKCDDGDKKYNIDLEFQVPQPWSLKKRLEYARRQNRRLLESPALRDDKMGDRNKKRKKRDSSCSGKRRRN